MKAFRILVALPIALGGLALTAGLSGQTPNPPSNSGPQSMVTICHRIGGAGDPILLTVPQNALQAHLSHGDFYPINGTHCEGVEPPGV